MRGPLGGRQEVSIPNESVEIVVCRGAGYADRLRRYKIKVDGVVQGTLGAHEVLRLTVAAGTHVLSAEIDWCGSKQVRFQAAPGQSLSFECGNALSGWRLMLALVYVLFRRNEYLWLRPAFDKNAA